jgi:hypothetical protein
MLPLWFACAKMWVYWRIHGFWYFIWKILTGESHPKTPYFIPAILSIQQRAKYSSYRLYHEIAIKNG